MKDTSLKLYQVLYSALDTALSIPVYSVVPKNSIFPYVRIGNIVANEATGAKDRFVTYGTIDVSVYTASDTYGGSKIDMLTYTNLIKQALKPTKTSVLNMASSFNMTIWYISNESQREERTDDKTALINTIQYYFEIEEL